ncbi:MAG: hypothetical protein SGJ19_06460 [Planctomycetia bacterium]|nr:hypothetical protein [Planctomycetia bacterium]
MKPALYQSIDDFDSWIGSQSAPDIAGPGIRLVQTSLGPTACIEVISAPSFTNRFDGEHSCFTRPGWLEIRLDRTLREQHETVHQVVIKKYRSMALVVKGERLRQWHYVGEAQLSSSGGANGVRSQYSYRLAEALPRNLWVALGGFENWLLSIEKTEYRNLTAEQCLELIATRWTTDKKEFVVERYEGDSLMGLSDDADRCVLYHCRDDDVENMSFHPDLRGDPEELFTFGENDVQARHVITRSMALECVRHFLATGGEPGPLLQTPGT